MNTAELERLTPDSKVLIGGEWFAPVFDLLQSRRCRCRLICWGDFRDQANFHLHPKARGMALTALNIPGLFEQAVAALVSQSCRKIALFCPPPENPVNYSNHPLIRHYYREALRCYTRQSPLIIDNRAGTGDRVLKDLWDKEHFDGLIFCANSRCPDSNERVFEPQTLGLPDTVRLIMAYMVPYQAVRYPRVPAIVFDHRSLGASCVDLLLNSSDPAPDLLWPPVWKTPKNLALHHH